MLLGPRRTSTAQSFWSMIILRLLLYSIFVIGIEGRGLAVKDFYCSTNPEPKPRRPYPLQASGLSLPSWVVPAPSVP